MCVAEWVEQCAGVSQVRRRHKENEFDVICTGIDRFDLLVKVLLLVFANQPPDRQQQFSHDEVIKGVHLHCHGSGCDGDRRSTGAHDEGDCLSTKD